MNSKEMVSVPREWAQHYADLLEERCGYEKAEQVKAFLAKPAEQHQCEPVAEFRLKMLECLANGWQMTVYPADECIVQVGESLTLMTALSDGRRIAVIAPQPMPKGTRFVDCHIIRTDGFGIGAPAELDERADAGKCLDGGDCGVGGICKWCPHASSTLERKPSDDIPDFTPGNGNKAERRATELVAQLQADLTGRDQQIDALSLDAGRYRWLRSRDLETISKGGVFAGLTPDNLVLNEETLDHAIDAAMAKPKCRHCDDTGQIMVGRSGQAEDGNAPIMEPCEDCDRGMPDLASRPEERGTPESEPCSGCGTPGWTGACNKCVPY
ncbi:hypothetical protein D3C81_178540 [compost metagenome]